MHPYNNQQAWANIAMRRCDDSAGSIDDGSISSMGSSSRRNRTGASPIPIKSSSHKDKRMAALLGANNNKKKKQKNSKLMDYSFGNLNASKNTLGQSSSSSRKRQFMSSSSNWHDTLAQLELNDSNTSLNSLALQDLSVLPFTELPGLSIRLPTNDNFVHQSPRDGDLDDLMSKGTDDDDDDMDDLSARSRSSSIKSKNNASLAMQLSSLGKSKSLHVTMDRSNQSHDGSVTSRRTSATAPPELSRRRSSERNHIVKSLEHALAVPDNASKLETLPENDATTVTISFRLKKRNSDGDQKTNHQWPRTTTTTTTSSGSRSSTGGALADMLKESRREKLKELLEKPNFFAEKPLNRASLRPSFKFHSISSVEAIPAKHRPSTLQAASEQRAKKEAELTAAFNEGMRDFSSRTSTSEGNTNKKSPVRSPKMKSRKSYLPMGLAAASSLPFEGSDLMGGMVDASEKRASTTSTSKAYIMEYMKELQLDASAKTNKRGSSSIRRTSSAVALPKPKLRRAQTAPDDSFRSMSVATGGESSSKSRRRSLSDKSSKAEAEIEALKALAGNALKSSLRRASTAPTNKLRDSSARSKSPIPTSITVVKKSMSNSSRHSNNDKSSRGSSSFLPSSLQQQAQTTNSSEASFSSLPPLQPIVAADKADQDYPHRGRRPHLKHKDLNLMPHDMDDSLTSMTTATDDVTAASTTIRNHSNRPMRSSSSKSLLLAQDSLPDLMHMERRTSSRRSLSSRSLNTALSEGDDCSVQGRPVARRIKRQSSAVLGGSRIRTLWGVTSTAA